MAMSPRKMMAMSKDLAKAAKMMEGGKVKKMRGGGMAMKPKKMRGGGMTPAMKRGGGMAKKKNAKKKTKKKAKKK